MQWPRKWLATKIVYLPTYRRTVGTRTDRKIAGTNSGHEPQGHPGLGWVSYRIKGDLGRKRGELLKQRSRVLLAILLLTLMPISIEELVEILGYRNKETFRENYIKPLRNNRLIEYTLTQANDPNQQYRITQRGMNLLLGSRVWLENKIWCNFY